jgi:hypothetical protein
VKNVLHTDSSVFPIRSGDCLQFTIKTSQLQLVFAKIYNWRPM